MDCNILCYPRPDAVFIGGHGGRLIEMMERITGVLNPGGVIVFNSVSQESCVLFEESIGRLGLAIEETHEISIDDYNSIKIMKAK